MRKRLDGGDWASSPAGGGSEDGDSARALVSPTTLLPARPGAEREVRQHAPQRGTWTFPSQTAGGKACDGGTVGSDWARSIGGARASGAPSLPCAARGALTGREAAGGGGGSPGRSREKVACRQEREKRQLGMACPLRAAGCGLRAAGCGSEGRPWASHSRVIRSTPSRSTAERQGKIATAVGGGGEGGRWEGGPARLLRHQCTPRARSLRCPPRLADVLVAAPIRAPGAFSARASKRRNYIPCSALAAPASDKAVCPLLSACLTPFLSLHLQKKIQKKNPKKTPLPPRLLLLFESSLARVFELSETRLSLPVLSPLPNLTH